MELSLSRSLCDGSTYRVPLYVPMEVLTTICGFASAYPLSLERDEWDYLFEDSWRVRAVQRMRLVSKVFNSAATPFLIQQVSLSPNYDSVSRLNDIADSVFGKHVKSICIDCRLFNEEIGSHPADYANALNTTSMFSIYPKEKLREGYKSYCELALKQQECREQGLHLECLINAFTKMPNLQEVLLSARHRSWSMKKTYRKILSMRAPGVSIDSQYDHMVEPDAVFFSAEDAERTSHREKYLTLMSQYLLTLSLPPVAPRIKNLRLLTLDASHPISAFTGVFGSVNDFHYSLRTIFRGLRKLDLSVSRGLLPGLFTPTNDSDDNGAKQWEHLLKDCLGAAKQVEALSLSFPSYPRDPYRHLTDIIETVSFPHLRALRLAGSSFKESKLTKFILDHAATLRSVILRCEITDGRWESCIASIKAHGNTHFETFALESCSENNRSQGRRTGFFHYEAPSDVMLDYLYAEGFNPVVQVTVEDLTSTSGVAFAAQDQN